MRGLYAIIDRDALTPFGLDVGDVARALCDGGVRAIQLRAKGVLYEALLPLAARVRDACAASGDDVAAFVDDDVDVAARLEMGVHLGQADVSPITARARLGGSARIGFSTHDEAQLRHALSLPVDYVALGPVRSTSNKRLPEPTVGLAEAARLAKLAKTLAPQRPLVAIGGVGVDVVSELASFDALAVIGAVLPAEGETGRAALSTISRRARALTDAMASATHAMSTEAV